MDDTRPVPGFTMRELRILRDATAAYVSVLRDFDQWVEQAADVNRLIRPDYAGSLDDLRDEVRSAIAARVVGTPHSIALAVAALLGETS